MHRREFLKRLGGCAAGGLGLSLAPGVAFPAQRTVWTVTGRLPVAAMGITLPHEHVLVDFIGADKIRPGRYDPDEVFAVVRPFLAELKRAGCRTLCECTPNYLGRDPRLLRRLSQATGLYILTNTGLYGAAKDRFVPRYAYAETEQQLARRWVQEFRTGLDGTSIRPGFIKIGVDAGPLSAIDRKLVAAAALTHRQSGLTIAAHTGDGEAALEELDILAHYGVSSDAFIWVHAQNERSWDRIEQAAARGAWIEFDGLSENNVADYVRRLERIRSKGLLNQVLVSHDAGWYHVGEPGGGRYRPHTTLLTRLLPELRRRRWSDHELRQLTVLNPQAAFAIRRRLMLNAPGGR